MFAAGEQIIEEGSEGSGFYILGDGKVEILRGGRPITQLSGGGVPGKMALFNENLRTAEVQAVNPVSYFSFQRRTLSAACSGRNPRQ